MYFGCCSANNPCVMWLTCSCAHLCTRTGLVECWTLETANSPAQAPWQSLFCSSDSLFLHAAPLHHAAHILTSWDVRTPSDDKVTWQSYWHTDFLLLWFLFPPSSFFSHHQILDVHDTMSLWLELHAFNSKAEYPNSLYVRYYCGKLPRGLFVCLFVWLIVFLEKFCIDLLIFAFYQSMINCNPTHSN